MFHFDLLDGQNDGVSRSPSRETRDAYRTRRSALSTLRRLLGLRT